MRRALGDVLLSACALSLLLVILMAFDGRVREQVRLRLEGPGRASSDIAAAGTQAREFFDVLVQSAKFQSREHGPLMVLVIAGTVLTIFMLRT